MNYKNKHKQAFSIIEVMVGIFIFTLGISAVFMIIMSTININIYNKNFIIASNLAREQIELIRNIRDTNYKKLQKWNMLHPYSKNYMTVFTGSSDYYKLENRFSSVTNEFPIKISTGTSVSDFRQTLQDESDTSEEAYRLCLDDKNRYIYCTYSAGENKTHFYRFIEIQYIDKQQLGSSDKIINAFKIQSKVYWNQKGVHDTEINTVLADWKRL